MKKNIRPALVVAAALAGATSFAATAQAAELTVSGQINRALMVVDDGEDTEAHFVDNSASSSRVLFNAIGDVNEQVKIGSLMELEFQSNPSNVVSQDDPQIAGEFVERKIEVYLKSALGNLYLGQGDGAANGFTEFDLSGVGAAALMGSTHLVGGGMAFLDDGVAGVDTIGNAVNNFDFESRYDRVVYQTSSLGPVTLAASAGRKDEMVYEVSARYASDFDFGKLVAGIGYSTEESDGPGSEDIFGGSIAVLLPAGFNAALSYSQADSDANDLDPYQVMLRVGYKTGAHAIAADYAMAEDHRAEGDEGTMMGLNYVFTPVKWAELYTTAKLYSLDRDGADFDDITLVTAGSRVKF